MIEKIDKNIRITCADCNSKMYPNRGKFKEGELRKAKMVKTMFTQVGKMSEHMWVKITNIIKTEDILQVEGTLYNDPCNLTNIAFGDLVVVSASKIEDVRNSLR